MVGGGQKYDVFALYIRYCGVGAGGWYSSAGVPQGFCAGGAEFPAYGGSTGGNQVFDAYGQ